MPKVPGARDRLVETQSARVAKFRCLESCGSHARSDMNEKHAVTRGHTLDVSGAKRAGKAPHSQRLLRARCAVFTVACVLGSFGCTAARATTAEPHSAAKFSSPAKGPVEVPRSIITPEITTDIPELLKQALDLGEAHHYDAAGRGYDRVFDLDPDGSTAESALFKAAEMYDYGGLMEEALARYEQVSRRFPTSPDDRVARVRALRLLTHLEQYERAGELAELTATKYKDLQGIDQIAVLAARALARIAVGDDVHAEYFVSKARDIIERENLDAAGSLPRELAPIYFALCEVRRLRAERIHFVPVPENFGGALERRCQLLLDAQGAYSDAMRAYDAHWSAMAGFRVGELYQKLHEELMHVPTPKAAVTERQRRLFEGAMRLRYSILLDKAQTMMDHTVTMADRTGEQSPWVLKARQARDSIAEATRNEHDALARLPYTREQLQAALDSFASGRGP
jgi:tetratricopeptide (TPR) repeat protein